MSSFQLSRLAEQDLKEIGRYTEKTWGRKQRNVYLSDLDKCFYRLADSPDLGGTCDEIRIGYRRFYQGKHVIFYRKVENGIVIVRILHERMDFERHFSLCVDK
jgi:toxin ParE1/3/4